MLWGGHEGGLELRKRASGALALHGRFPYGKRAVLSDGGRTGRPRKEAFAPRAFAYRVERPEEDIHLLIGHSYDRPLASRGAGTLDLTDSDDALTFAATLTADMQEVSYVRDFLAGFAAGLMLRTLIQHKPVSLVTRPAGADESNPAYFWPEGYLYVAFCLNVRGLVLQTDFHSEQNPSDSLNETRTWWSFRENVQQDPSLAIAFLDLFAGDEPDWSVPELFRTGRALRLAERFYARENIAKDEG